MEELELKRKQIDEIDEQLVELFEKRMELVAKIGVIKEEKGLQVLNFKREEEVIKKAIAHLKNKELSHELEIFFRSLMDSSKKIQCKRIQSNRIKKAED